MNRNELSVTAVMVTGHDPARRRIARLTAESFPRQTYRDTELLIINQGEIPLLTRPIARVREVMAGRGLVVGQLRNLAWKYVSTDLMTCWDDDDIYHPDRLDAQIQRYTGKPVALDTEVIVNLQSNEAMVFYRRTGFENSLLWPTAAKSRYAESPRGSDTTFVNALSQEFGNVQTIENDPLLYVRLFHGRNVWDAEHFFEVPRKHAAADPSGDHVRIRLPSERESQALEGMLPQYRDAFPKSPAVSTTPGKRSQNQAETKHQFAEDFSTPEWWRSWGFPQAPQHTLTVQEPDRPSLKVTWQAGQHYGTTFRYRFAEHHETEPTSLRFDYDVKFGASFTGGGKLPGFGGTYGRSGWGCQPNNGRNGWSARVGFDARDDRFVRLYFYAYLVNQPEKCGKDLAFWERDGKIFEFQRETWYRLTGICSLNSPDGHDGALRAMVDGEPAFEQHGLQFRTCAKLKIEEFWFDCFHGGKTPSPVSMDASFANLQLAWPRTEQDSFLGQ